jgi:hypothetical protein
VLAERTSHQERTSTVRRREGPWPSVLAGGVLAGTLDIVYACVFWALKADVPPSRILQSVAAGLLGEASFTGGAASAGLGLLLHYAVMNYIVVPLSAAPGGSRDPTWIALTVAVHACFIGVPIAWLAGRAAVDR